MRNGLVQLGAWAAATGAAVALSWLGVHAVLTGAAFERPKALPLPSPAAAKVSSEQSAAPARQTTAPPEPTPAPTPTPTPSPTAPSTPRVGAATQRPAAATTPAGPAGNAAPRSSATVSTVHSYLLPGGRVALDLQPASADLVSATPTPGWQMQVWHGDEWMRIDFSHEGAVNSVFVTWNGHAPDVQTVVP